MLDVLLGFSVIGFVIAVGWLLAKLGIVDARQRVPLNQVAFFAASPALLFTILARADVALLFSGSLVAHLLAVTIVGIPLAAALWWWGTRDVGKLLIASHAGVYTNSNNIGLPVAVYVIGDGQYVAPLLLLQLLVMSPLLLAGLDMAAEGRVSLRKVLAQPVRNPIVFGSALGVVVAVLGWELPRVVLAPLELLGGAAVPLMLLAFGMSLHGARPLAEAESRMVVVAATMAKSVVLPVVAWLAATYVVQLPPDMVFAAVVVAALPTAQNMYQYALRYATAELVARDAVLLTTALSLPTLLVVALLLHPGANV
ncbi:AEC family transporter [Tessaracoccus sp. OH4464_COT-324]|uniref:AEC family transporter n=1 Tax=Tessaracoccus sp. OH4464_COT-324 TaxID=2491059 RepID=UPI000F633EA2|nr:AEC family transporter [Tessaracoccus sp. OH4464_COT-324]RRD46946.1 AEC family transporter [Tessaracoccus sp. OH4464_COT-324]